MIRNAGPAQSVEARHRWVQNSLIARALRQDDARATQSLRPRRTVVLPSDFSSTFPVGSFIDPRLPPENSVRSSDAASIA